MDGFEMLLLNEFLQLTDGVYLICYSSVKYQVGQRSLSHVCFHRNVQY